MLVLGESLLDFLGEEKLVFLGYQKPQLSGLKYPKTEKTLFIYKLTLLIISQSRKVPLEVPNFGTLCRFWKTRNCFLSKMSCSFSK